MLNQLIKLGVFVALGIWLKHRGKGLLFLIITLGITWITHNEFLSYLEQSGNNRFLEISYVLKWLIFLLALGIYYLLVERRIRKDPSADRNTIENPDLHHLKGDGFDFLRQKKTLESEMDKTLKNPSKK